MGAYDDRPYTVGKGKPPKQHSWKKGQSGNPRGPKAKKAKAEMQRAELLALLMNQTVRPVIGGRQVAMTLREYILLQNINDAAQGTKAERRKATELLIKMGAFEAPRSEISGHNLSLTTAQEVVDEIAAAFGFKAGDEKIPGWRED